MNRWPDIRVVSLKSGAGHLAFVGTMLGASALTFLRMSVVALLLPVGDFALYATVVAAGTFMAGPLSFGAIEGTIKAFPRLVAEGREAQMGRDASAIIRLAASRAIALAAPILVLGYVAKLEWAILGGLGMLVAFGNAANGVVASMQRAAGAPRTLAGGTLLRAAVTFGAVSLAATTGEPIVVIAAEIASMVIAAQLSAWLFFGRLRTDGIGAAETRERDRSGLLVFICYTMISVPFYLDRLYVTTTMGEAVAGRYAVLALLLLGASLLVNTIAQRAGPDAIRRIHRGEAGPALRTVSTWIAINAAVWVSALSCFGALIAWNWLPPALARYAIEPDMLWPLAAAGILLNTALLEFVVIGLDRERPWFMAATGFLTLTLAMALALWLLGANLLTLMWSLVACRCAYGLALGAILARALSKASGQQGTG